MKTSRVLFGKQVIEESAPNTQTGDRPFYDYLEGCLRHKTEMVIFEAARAVTELTGVTSRELTPAITVLQLFLSSSKPVLRFAAVRTLNKVGLTFNFVKCIHNLLTIGLFFEDNQMRHMHFKLASLKIFCCPQVGLFSKYEVIVTLNYVFKLEMFVDIVIENQRQRL